MKSPWVILMACTGVYALAAAEGGMAGVTLVELLEQFPHHKGLLSWLCGLNTAVGICLGVLWGYAINRLPYHMLGLASAFISCGAILSSAFTQHPEVLFVSFGIIQGLAKGMGLSIAAVKIQQRLGKRRNLAMGISFAAQSLMFLACPGIVRLIIDHYTWRGMFIIQAGINLNLIPCFLLMHDSTDDVPNIDIKSATAIKVKDTCSEDCEKINEDRKIEETNAENKPSLMGMLKGRPVCIPLFVAILACQLANVILFSLTPLLAVELGESKMRGALLISVAGSIGLVSRPIWGYIGDRWINPLFMSGVGGIVSGILVALLPAMPRYSLLAGITALTSAFAACYMATWGGTIVLIVGKHHLVYGTSVAFSSYGLGLMSPYIISGIVLDLIGTPQFTFITSGMIAAMGGIMFLITYFIFRQNPKQFGVDN